MKNKGFLSFLRGLGRAALCLIVGLTLNHHIGGFLETVAREEEEKAAERDQAESRDDTGDKT